MPVLLSDLATGRANNFNLIRFLAATTVIFSHSFQLSGHSPEPPVLLWGFSFGGLAVDIFFVISGFLVTGSLINNNSILHFFMSRIARIYPALIIAVFFSTLIGSFFSQLHFINYFSSPDTWIYFIKQSTSIVTAIPPPFLFTNNPFPYQLNGALWTLVWEIRVYLILGLIGYMMKKKHINYNTFRITIVSVWIIFSIIHITNEIHPLSSNFSVIQGIRFIALFFSGSTLYIFRNHVRLSYKIFILALTPIVLLPFFGYHLVFFSIYVFFIAYLVLFAAYVPKGRIQNFNQLGDYSYGIYIFGYPIQQTVAALVPGISSLNLFMFSMVLVLPLAIFSWHFIEKKFLKLIKGQINLLPH